jgi:hypothetical protein
VAGLLFAVMEVLDINGDGEPTPDEVNGPVA